MVSKAMMSSESTVWQTPEWFLELVRQVAPIALDPATALDNPTGARQFCGQGQTMCGLRLQWHIASAGGLVYVNPPYGPHLSGDIDPDAEIWRTRKVDGVKQRVLVGTGTGWGAKMAGHCGHGLYLVPARVETAWFRLLHGWAEWRLDWSSPEHGSRIHFRDPATGKRVPGTPFPSTVFYRGPEALRFCHVFGPHGTLIRAESRQSLMESAYTPDLFEGSAA